MNDIQASHRSSQRIRGWSATANCISMDGNVRAERPRSKEEEMVGIDSTNRTNGACKGSGLEAVSMCNFHVLGMKSIKAPAVNDK